MRSQGSTAILLKVVFLGVVDAVAVWAGVGLVLQANYALLAVLLVGAGLLNVLTLSRRAYPLRYLVPGLLFLFGMVVYPIFYTAYVSLTNLQTGNLLTKEQVLDLLDRRYVASHDPRTFSYTAFASEEGEIVLILRESESENVLVWADGRLGPLDPADPRFSVDEAGTVAVDGFREIVGVERYQFLGELEKLSIPYGSEYLRLSGLSEFRTYRKQYAFDTSTDRLTDLQTGTVYTPIEGVFTDEAGNEIEPGFQAWIGGRNFLSLFTSPGIRGDFGRVFAWTIVWSLLSVLLSFSLGLGLALLLNDRQLKLRVVYRTLLIVPYVMPVFISALVWRGMFNENFGIVNRIFQTLFHTKYSWLSDPMLARGVLIFVNIWLSFPYMMLISLGALQSIPEQLYEAARIDGAGMVHRFTRVTLPLLMISLAPLLIGSFAFAFNNFTLIYLVTAGRPAVLGAASPAGATDILISWTFRIAFEGGAGNQYGLASAISILIFAVIATISAIGFRFTKRLEEVYK